MRTSNKTVSVGGGHPEQVSFANGKAASSKCLPFHLIPTVALESLAKRLQLGIERKGDKAWNAVSSNQEVLTDREFAIERCSHIINHAMKLRDQLAHGPNPGQDTDSMEDNAGAISWGGAFLSCVVDALEKEVVAPSFKPVAEQAVPVIIPGFTYHCANGLLVGPLAKTVDHKYFCKTVYDVVWTRTGIPIKINQDLSDEKVRGFKIVFDFDR